MAKPTWMSEQWTVKDNKLVIQQNEKLTVAWWALNYEKTPRDARRLIARMLTKAIFSVNSIPVTAAAIKATVGNAQTKDATNEANVSGIVTAACMEGDSDGNPGYGPIYAGMPVTLDTISGCALTGVAQSWLPDEYIILGTAMRDGSHFDGLQEIPILLHKQHDKHDTYGVKFLEEISCEQPGWARMLMPVAGQGWSQATAGGTPGEGEYDIKVYNLLGYLNSGASSQFTIPAAYRHTKYRSGTFGIVSYEARTGRWTVISTPFKKPFIRGVLTQPLYPGGRAPIQVWASSLNSGGTDYLAVPLTGLFEMVEDWHTPPQLKILTGTRVSAVWDEDSQVYVVIAANELDYYGELVG